LKRSARLGSRSGTTGEFLVEVDNSGHARTVGLAADSLYPIPISILFHSITPPQALPGLEYSGEHRRWSRCFRRLEMLKRVVVQGEALTFGDAI
jgi:hypothetical protein